MAGIINRSFYDAAQKGREDGQAYNLNNLRQQAAQQSLASNALSQQQEMDAQKAAQVKEFAQQMLAAAQYAAKSPTPKAFVQQNFPQLVEKYGPGWATATDDDVRSQLLGFQAQFGSQLGVGPATPPGVSGAMYKYIDPVTKQPVYGGAEDVRGKTPFIEAPTAPPPSYSPVQTADGIGVLNSRTGQVRPTGIKPPEKPAEAPKQTETDKKARVLLASMENAEADISKMKDVDTGSIAQRMLGSNAITAPLQSDDYRKYESAGLRWAANLLYLKSGATATPDEIRSTWKQFFPQPGDGDGAKEQKAAARAQEVSAIKGVYDPNGAGAATAPAAPAAPQAAPVQVKSDAEYAALPSGAQYVAPDGSVRRKK